MLEVGHWTLFVLSNHLIFFGVLQYVFNVFGQNSDSCPGHEQPHQSNAVQTQNIRTRARFGIGRKPGRSSSFFVVCIADNIYVLFLLKPINLVLNSQR